MKTRITILCTLLLFVFACKNKKDSYSKAEPTILEGKKIDVSSIIHKKRGADLVEALYEELVSKSTELQELEEEIKLLEATQNLAVDSFRRFQERNNSYYDAAGKKLGLLKDSLVRNKLNSLILQSRQQFAKQAVSHLTLDSLIRKKGTTIADLYIMLKITKTLPLIEQYQQEQLPGTQPMQDFHQRLDSVARRIDSIIIRKDSLQ